jgi:TolB-like protein
MQEQRFLFGDFSLDAARGALSRRGEAVAIGHRAVALLAALVRAGGQAVTKAELIDAAWPGAVVEESNLSVQVAALRKLLGPAPAGGEAIATVARVGYRFCLPVERSEGAAVTGAAPAESRLSIAVLPLANHSDDASQAWFADGVTEDLIMALSRFRWFRVAGRSGSFAFRDHRLPAREVGARLAVRYLLEGSVRRSADRVRVTLHLTDAALDTELWGQHYDAAAADLLAVQDGIAEQVAGAIEPELLKLAATEAAARRPAASEDAQELVYRGISLFHRVRRASHLEARELFRQARRLAPHGGHAPLWLARVNAGIVAYGWSDTPEADLAEGAEAAIDGIRADERNPYAHYSLAIVSIYRLAFDEARRAARRAIELAPGFALGHLVLGMATLFGGDARGAIAPLTYGLRLNAFDPQNFVWHNVLSYAHLFAGEFQAAMAESLKAAEVRPDWAPALESALCAARAMGDEALAARLDRQRRILPREAADPIGPLRRHNPDWDRQIGDWITT